MDEYLPFENTIFCSSNCNFLRFSAHNLSLLLNFSLFLFLINKCTYNCQYHIVELIKYLCPKFNVMFKFTYSKYNPWALIFRGGAYTWKKFSLSKVIGILWLICYSFDSCYVSKYETKIQFHLSLFSPTSTSIDHLALPS